MTQTYLSYIYNRFPRRFSAPEQRTIFSLKELEDNINAYQDACPRMGCAAFDYDGDTSTITLDRLPFDFDHDDAIGDMRRMHKAYRNIEHFMCLSGKGFHFWMFCRGANGVQDPVQTCRLAYADIEKKVGVKNDPSLTRNAPAHMLGIPNTYNCRRGRYRIFVTEEDLEQGYEYILKKAENPSPEIVIYGAELFDLSPYRCAARAHAPAQPIQPIANLPTIGPEWLQKQPLFIQKWLTDADLCNHRTRFLAMLWLKKQGYPRAFAQAVAEYCYSKLPHPDGGTKLDRFYTKRPLESVYDKSVDYAFPSMAQLRAEGIIP